MKNLAKCNPGLKNNYSESLKKITVLKKNDCLDRINPKKLMHNILDICDSAMNMVL